MPLSGATIVLRSETGRAATQVPLKEIKPGDQVTRWSGATTASPPSSRPRSARWKGTIVGIGKLAGGNTAITLDSGKVIEVASDAPVTFGGRSVALSDVKRYEKVVIRTNPANNLGYGVAVATAATPDPTPPGEAPVTNPLPTGETSVSVTSFTDNVTKPLKAGETLLATLSGTPGGKAGFAIPGVVENVPMTETSPGVYEGSYTVPRGVSVAKASVLGRLTFAGVTSALIQAPGTITIAGQPPKITDFGPAKGATVETARPLIYAQFASPTVGVNTDDTRLTLDGKPVTPDAVTPTLLTYKPAEGLAGGPHVAHLSVTDLAGNATTLDWNFTVTTSKLIQSFTTNEPSGKSVGVGPDGRADPDRPAGRHGDGQPGQSGEGPPAARDRPRRLRRRVHRQGRRRGGQRPGRRPLHDTGRDGRDDQPLPPDCPSPPARRPRPRSSSR